MAKRKSAKKSTKKQAKKPVKKARKKTAKSTTKKRASRNPPHAATSPSPPSPQMHPARLTPVQLVELLKKAGAKDVAITNIATDVAGGLPTNADPPGTINLITYAAWLHQQRRTT